MMTVSGEEIKIDKKRTEFNPFIEGYGLWSQ
jgi:hypothetical protein